METVFFLKLKLNIIIIISDRSTYLKKGALKPLTIHPFVWYIRSNDEFTFYNLFSPTKPYQGQQNPIRPNKTLSGPTKPYQAQQNPIRPSLHLPSHANILFPCSAKDKWPDTRVPAVIDNDGRVMLFTQIHLHSICSLDLTKFPFDIQTCQLKFASWSYDGSSVS